MKMWKIFLLMAVISNTTRKITHVRWKIGWKISLLRNQTKKPKQTVLNNYH